MRITVLGKSPAWQDAGGACSGYLVEEADTVLLLDCGNGVFGKLRERIDFRQIGAVVLSHLHADHFLDLIPFAYALTYHPCQQPVPVHIWPGTDTPAKPRLYAPRGAGEVFERVTGAWGANGLVGNAFDVQEYDPTDLLEIGHLRVRFHPVPHFVPACAIEIASADDGARFTFGADSAPTEELVRFARDTDLLMIEATLPRPERDGMRGHLTPAEAGEHGSKAKVKQLVLTHFPAELGIDWVREEAERAFGAKVSVAAEGDVYTV